jgi:hypothetical protein
LDKNELKAKQTLKSNEKTILNKNKKLNINKKSLIRLTKTAFNAALFAATRVYQNPINK